MTFASKRWLHVANKVYVKTTILEVEKAHNVVIDLHNSGITI
jgi:hypothetical protein